MLGAAAFPEVSLRETDLKHTLRIFLTAVLKYFSFFADSKDKGLHSKDLRCSAWSLGNKVGFFYFYFL